MGATKRMPRNLLNFTLSGIDELSMFPSPEERQKALEELGRSFRWWEIALGIVATATAAIVVNFGLKIAIKWAIPNVSRATGEALDMLRFVVMAIAVFLVLRALHRWGVRPALRQRLIQTGVPVCMGCGYLLRGLPETTAKCPECGRSVDETVRDILRQTRVSQHNDAAD